MADSVRWTMTPYGPVLIPIHTQNPEEFEGIHGNVKIPEKGKSISV